MTRALPNRRRFLRGLGGAAVAVPFLGSVAEQEARAAGVTAAAAPKRLIVMFTHYGCITNRWFPRTSHGPLTSDDYRAVPTLAPLGANAGKLLMVRGIRAMNEWSFNGTLGQKNDPYTNACGSYFTCHPLAPNASVSAAQAPGKFDGKPTGRSLDHICAEQVNVGNGGNGTPLFVQIGGINGSDVNTQAVISYDQPGRIYPGVGSPLEIFNSLTGLYAQGPVGPDTYRMARGRSVIDIVRQDLQTLQRVKMSGRDQKLLSDWVDILHYASRDVVRLCSADTPAMLGLTKESVSAAQGSGNSADLSKVAPVILDLATLSALCDTNRVIFLKFPPHYIFRFLGQTIESESISHRIGDASMNGTCIADAINMVAAIDGWYTKQFAYLVNRLDSFTQAEGTLLDNSATVWFQEFSDGNARNLNNMPILQAGSCGGYFKTGWTVNVEGGRPDLTQGHSEDDCLAGYPLANPSDAGTPPDVATMPINKYYCNLMNAIGVKAGADGYAVKGGTAPVTCFGKYDDSRLFGTDQPAKISNPGEYAELRAH